MAFAAVIFSTALLLYCFLHYLKSALALSHWKNKDFSVNAVDIAVWSLLWYGFSVSLIIYNKWLLNSWEGGFEFPLMMSTVHMILKLILATIVTIFFVMFLFCKLFI